MTSPRRSASETSIGPLETGRLAQRSAALLHPGRAPLHELRGGHRGGAEQARAQARIAQEAGSRLPYEACFAPEAAAEEERGFAYGDHVRAGGVERARRCGAEGEAAQR